MSSDANRFISNLKEKYPISIVEILRSSNSLNRNVIFTWIETFSE